MLVDIVCRCLIEFLDGPQPSHWQGVLLVAAMFSTCVIDSLLHQHILTHISLLALHVRATLVHAIYLRAVTISSAAHQSFPCGHIVDLIASDVQHVQDFFANQADKLCCAPLQITVAVLILHRELGNSAFGALLVIIVTICLNACCTNLVKKTAVCFSFLVGVHGRSVRWAKWYLSRQKKRKLKEKKRKIGEIAHTKFVRKVFTIFTIFQLGTLKLMGNFFFFIFVKVLLNFVKFHSKRRFLKTWHFEDSCKNLSFMRDLNNSPTIPGVSTARSLSLRIKIAYLRSSRLLVILPSIFPNNCA